MPCTQWGTLTHICSQWGMMEERRITAMYAVGDAQCHRSPVGDGRGEEDHCHVRSEGHSHMFPVGDDGGEEDHCHVRSGGR